MPDTEIGLGDKEAVTMPVRNAYIKFDSQEDSVLGFYELATHSAFSRLTNDIFCVPWNILQLLDARSVQYKFATEDELTHARPLWNFADSPSG
jgi:hypothetical protein